MPGLITILILAAGFGSLEGRDETAQTYYKEAQARIADGDSAKALHLLDKALELDTQHGPSLIERGTLKLYSDDLESARKDFERALRSESARTKSQAHIGLGDTYRWTLTRYQDAIGEYQQALELDSVNCKALYYLAQSWFALGETEGYRKASETLARLICLDPGYRDAYSLWRDKLRDHPKDELLMVSRCIEDYLARHPEKNTLWLDLARDRFDLGEVDRALEALDSLKKNSPGYKSPERLLLEARCLLDSGDTLGFETCYAGALKEAEKSGGFGRLFMEARPIFSPEEKERWDSRKSPADRAALFRKFWISRDPDPTTFHNERLVVHYLRLREAEKSYSQLSPYIRFQNTLNYFRLLRTDLMPQTFDPYIYWSPYRELALDQRGLLFIRHGPPSQIKRLDPDEVLNTNETWFYGSRFFIFHRSGGTGDFFYVPVSREGAGNINLAMETETFRDPLPPYVQEYYAAEFLRQDGRLELEFYQSVPAAAVTGQEPGPMATLAIFDTTWVELARDSTALKSVWTGTDSLWLAVNRAVVNPGHCFYALSMDLPGYRAVIRKKLELKAYRNDELDLSGIILGNPVSGAEEVIHQRKGVEILPRPSLVFRPGEPVMVYFEIYGLKKNTQGNRSFRESIRIIEVEDKSDPTASIIDGPSKSGKEAPKILSLTFDRDLLETNGPVTEHFEINTSELVPGFYRLVLEVLDNSNDLKKNVTWYFDLSD
ncbi:MAG TPA: tetratricopeptide repeat protein [archaeon]|nr:tetratricopeptide repeat protein [archaeon]